MSTSFYFTCLDHDPVLQSDEISQHDDHHLENAILAAQGLPGDCDDRDDENYFVLSARRFLDQHPKCALGIVDEYGEPRSIPGRQADRVRAHLDLQLIRAQDMRLNGLAVIRDADLAIARTTHLQDTIRAMDAIPHGTNTQENS